MLCRSIRVCQWKNPLKLFHMQVDLHGHILVPVIALHARFLSFEVFFTLNDDAFDHTVEL